jgi:tetratricopeptide (TPR) repeat protein
MAIASTASDASEQGAEDRVQEALRVAKGSLAKGAALARAAKADGLSNPALHHLIAIDLKETGQPETAIAELGLGLHLAPDDSRMITLVGFCLMDLDRRQEAAQVFQTALKLDPRSPRAAYGYGWVAERLGALDAAESAFQRAADLDPHYADALAGLSGLAVRRREWDRARALAQRAIEADARQTDALMNLVRADIGQKDYAVADWRLQTIIDLPHLKPLARANAKIMRGDALDGARCYPQAFAAYEAGKADLKALFAPVYDAPGAHGATDAVRQILAEFEATPVAAWKASGYLPQTDTRGHAFLMGFPRSGTTLLEQVLSTHPDIVTLEERPVMLDAELEFLTQEGGVTRLAGVAGVLLEPFRRSYWRKVREFGVEPQGKVFVDKHPLNTFRLPLICKVFPEPNVIFALRDPRDVVLSCFRRSFNMNATMYAFNTLEGAARHYDAVMTAGEVYRRDLSMNVHVVRYEDVVLDFEGTGRALCDFLGVEWTDELRNFAETAKAKRIATPSSTQVGRGLYDEGMGQWRNYDFALEPVMPILAPWIEKFGYEPA